MTNFPQLTTEACDVSSAGATLAAVDQLGDLINKYGSPVPRGGVDKLSGFINTRPSFDLALTASRIVVSVASLLVMAGVGCGDRTTTGTAAKRPKPPVATANSPGAAAVEKPVRPTKPAATQAAAESPAPAGRDFQPQYAQAPAAAAPPSVRRSLADLAEQAAAEEFRLPEIDEGKVAAAGIRKLEGKHITIYTDVPESDDINELTKVFDAAVSLYCDYFEFDPAKVAQWKLVAYLVQDKERFQGAGLFPDNLPPFINGFTRGSEFWWYEQPSAYYRRHLMIHEGVHAFMYRWLGGAGPPWYTEGMAELLGTHRWADDKLQLAIMPQTKDEVPYWGRVKIVKDQFAADKGLQLTDVFKLDSQSHLRNEAYGWCWAAAQFLDAHPLAHDAFRELRHNAQDRSIDFSAKLVEKLKADWPQIAEDWQLFVVNCDYGYDVARAAIVRKESAALPAGGGTTTIAANRGWQSSGFQVEAGKAYRIEAAGRYTIGGDAAKPWLCEPNGITLHYHQGQPLGKLLAGVSEAADTARGLTPLARPTPIGSAGEFRPEHSGVLYFCVNESPAGLAENHGTVAVRVLQER